MSLSDRDLELAKKHGRTLTNGKPTNDTDIYLFHDDELVAMLLERDAQGGDAVGDWRIDTTAGKPVLVYKDYSVIEDEQASYVLSLIRDQLAIKEKDDAVREALEKAADICESISDDYYKKEHHRMPELKTDAEAGASDCEYAIRALIEPKD